MTPPNSDSASNGFFNLTMRYCCTWYSKFMVPAARIIVVSLWEDYPLWIACIWLVWNKQQLLVSTTTRAPSAVASSFSEKSAIADCLSLGSILLLKKAKDYQLWGSTDHIGDRILSHQSKKNDDKANNLQGVMKDRTIQEKKRILTTTSDDRLKDAVESALIDSLPFLPETTGSAVTQSSSPPQQQRYVELLVHNVSHTDFVLSLDAAPADLTEESSNPSNDENSYCLCRPRFSAFEEYSKRIVDFIADQSDTPPTLLKQERQTNSNIPPFDAVNHAVYAQNLIRFPRYERSGDNNKKNQINAQPSEALAKIPVGVPLTCGKWKDGRNVSMEQHLKVSSSELSDLRIRGRDAQRVLSATEANTSSPTLPLHINAVFFPLLASLLPLWQANIEEKYSLSPLSGTSQQAQNQQKNNRSFASVKQVLLLTTGVATPRNWTHSANGNSTYYCAGLMKWFMRIVYPNIVVVHVHSGPEQDIQRYDENITFVQQELLPRIQAYRDAHAKSLPYPDGLDTRKVSNSDNDLPFSTEWRKSFSVTLSIADGTSARTHAIQAALRTYKPTYYHFWQLKTFWHNSKIVDSDIEVHSFEEMETLPPIETSQLGVDRPMVLQVVQEMKRFRNDMIEILNKGDDDNDIRNFWLRKTRKPVLAVLAVKVADGGHKLYRGTNMEVSMPTGSLCAERNVIGSALADNPSLKRQDLKLIAVLAVPVPNPRLHTRDASTNLSFVRPASTNSLASTQHVEDSSSHDGKPPWIPSRKSSIGEDEDWILQDPSSTLSNAGNKSGTLFHVPPTMVHHPSSSSLLSLSASSTPIRRISLYNNHSQQQPQMHKRTVLIHSEADLNPLRPCGACNEWLKKIAESNPYFTIVTFTDAACNGVYCTPCCEE